MQGQPNGCSLSNASQNTKNGSQTDGGRSSGVCLDDLLQEQQAIRQRVQTERRSYQKSEHTKQTQELFANHLLSSTNICFVRQLSAIMPALRQIYYDERLHHVIEILQ